MKLRIILLAFVAIFALSHGSPLSKAENENRLSKCGSIYKSKVWSGIEANQSSAPWALEMHTSSMLCTATLISSRHALTATHCFTGIQQEGWSRVVQNKRNCRNGHYFIEDSRILNPIKFQSNDVYLDTGVKRVILLNACLDKIVPASGDGKDQIYEDFAIVDLSKDLEFSDTLQPACVAPPGPPVPVGLELHYFGFGKDPESGTVGKLRYEKIKSIENLLRMKSHYFMAIDPDHLRIACPGDSGGGVMSTKGDKVTIIGVLSQTNCMKLAERKALVPLEIYSSVAYYAKHVCTYSGICSHGDLAVAKKDDPHEQEMKEMEKGKKKADGGWNLPFVALSMIALMFY